MSITVRETAKGVTIRTTGADAVRLLAHMAAAIGHQGTAAAPNAVPKRPKENAGALGASGPEIVSVALKLKQG
ncbi:hypothetical protein [Simplicispira psychrophila]|uniref:hypothetical protein n=1 Tax=Simplicispira psychrophila TaxID=80882 RepID=UPI0004879517|nr:hypothetical protein [Simplicispira psychrophila]